MPTSCTIMLGYWYCTVWYRPVFPFASWRVPVSYNLYFLGNCTVPLITLATLLLTFFNFAVSFLRCRYPSHTAFSGYRLTTSYMVVKCSFLSCSCYPPWWCPTCYHPTFWFCMLRAVNDHSTFFSCNCLFQTSHFVGTGKLFFFRCISLPFLTSNLTCHLSACSAFLSWKSSEWHVDLSL